MVNNMVRNTPTFGGYNKRFGRVWFRGKQRKGIKLHGYVGKTKLGPNIFSHSLKTFKRVK